MSQATKTPGRPKLPAEERRVATSFRLPADTIAKLARVAEKAGVSQAGWIEQQVRKTKEP